jgi:hypothetical protein
MENGVLHLEVVHEFGAAAHAEFVAGVPVALAQYGVYELPGALAGPLGAVNDGDLSTTPLTVDVLPLPNVQTLIQTPVP